MVEPSALGRQWLTRGSSFSRSPLPVIKGSSITIPRLLNWLLDNRRVAQHWAFATRNVHGASAIGP